MIFLIEESSMEALTLLYLAIAGVLGFLFATGIFSLIYDLKDPAVRRNYSREKWRKGSGKFILENTQVALVLVALGLIGVTAEMAATPGWPWVFIGFFGAGGVFTVWTWELGRRRQW